MPRLALLVLPGLLPGGPTVSCCRSRNPQAGPKQLKAPKTPSQGLAKAEMGWEHPHFALPTARLGCSTLEASLPLKIIMTSSQRPPQPPPKGHRNLPKATTIS